MDWITIAIIVGIVVVLCLVQFLTHAGSRPNDGKIACMMPKEQNSAKGSALKSERSLSEDSKRAESKEKQVT